MRLAGGNNVTTGRVEVSCHSAVQCCGQLVHQVRYHGVWGTICDDEFGLEEAGVVCR